MNMLLKISNVYQVVIWSITGGDYALGIFDTIAPKKDYISLLLSICVIIFSVFVICSNVLLLFNSKFFLAKNLNLNKWLNFIQIVNFSVLGLSFYMIVGVHLTGYYYYDKVQEVSYTFSFYKLTIDSSYSKSNIIFIGLNLIPLILFLVFNNIIKKNEFFDIQDIL
jgi:hypothetical protein